MEPLAIFVGGTIAAVLVVVAAYFVWRQRAILRALHFDAKLSADHRRYLLKQSHRRIFGSVLLLILAAMMVGFLFLDLEHGNEEAAKQSVRFLSFYTMTMLLVLLAILVLAVVDFWATARFSFQQQKQLLQEHHDMLEAELLEHRHRNTDLN